MLDIVITLLIIAIALVVLYKSLHGKNSCSPCGQKRICASRDQGQNGEQLVQIGRAPICLPK